MQSDYQNFIQKNTNLVLLYLYIIYARIDVKNKEKKN